MKKLRNQHSIEKMSKVFRVSKSGYYRFLTSSHGKRAQEEKILGGEIEVLFHEHKSRAGSPKIWVDLKEKGYACGRKRVAFLADKGEDHSYAVSMSVCSREFLHGNVHP
ncbi:IS3 family transposase [Candidatus Neptunichlamydia sp. REUL1]|uniref:IS3 family transposase n=1 Tax=Candidatus Neptunichlamydia sp. REUL1 TaxID=3064277 RepID=UPI00292F29FA|nr:IS3 family transposase [Candidatus Neptunochlamydia sp. REUL1]